MDMNELVNTLKQRRKALAYKIWKQAYLITLGTNELLSAKRNESIFPKSPEEACPELYPPKPKIDMPDFLKEKWLKKGGR